MRANLARRISEELDRAWDAQDQNRIVTSDFGEEDEDNEDTHNELDVHQILYDVLKKEFGSHGQAVGWDGCDKPTVGVLVMVGNDEIGKICRGANGFEKLLKFSFAVRLYSAFTAAGMAVAYARDNVSSVCQRLGY